MVIKELIAHAVLLSLPLWLLIEQLLSSRRSVDHAQDPTLLNAIPGRGAARDPALTSRIGGLHPHLLLEERCQHHADDIRERFAQAAGDDAVELGVGSFAERAVHFANEGDFMFMRLMICAILLCLTVMPVAAQIDPQSLVGVWEGTYEVRHPIRGPQSGSIVITISKVENGKVYLRSETMGARANLPVDYMSYLTPTGYAHTAPTGHTSTTVVEGDKMRLTATAGGNPFTANLVKKK